MKNNKKIIIILISISVILILALVGSLAYIQITKDSDKKENIESKEEKEDTQEDTQEDKEDIITQAEEMAIQTFNSRLLPFEGENSASKVKSLISLINISNQSEQEVFLSDEGITDISQVETGKKYLVEFNYDDVGYINEVIITEKKDNVGGNSEDENLIVSMAVVTFNSQFTSYQGEINEQQLQTLIDKAVSSNEQNPEHQVSATSNNLDNITNLDKDAKYIVSFSYDSEGYINTLIIDKKEEINIFDTAIEIQNGLLNSANNAADSYREQLEEEESLGGIKINGVEVNF